jgi:hypothetical protein
VIALASALGVSCDAFLDGDGEAPTDELHRSRGRPRKAEDQPAIPRRPRSRPRKGE